MTYGWAGSDHGEPTRDESLLEPPGRFEEGGRDLLTQVSRWIVSGAVIWMLAGPGRPLLLAGLVGFGGTALAAPTALSWLFRRRIGSGYLDARSRWWVLGCCGAIAAVIAALFLLAAQAAEPIRDWLGAAGGGWGFLVALGGGLLASRRILRRQRAAFR